MTLEEQRIAIAEACGWKETKDGLSWYVPGEGFGNDPLGSLPDYMNDLNAMHEAEKVLTWSQQNAYRKWLEALWRTEDDAEHVYEWHATASQRAEAFLRTLGFWKDA